MPNSIVWLCNYSDLELINIYGIKIEFSKITNAKIMYKYHEELTNSTISDSDNAEYTRLLNLSVQKNRSWLSAEYINPENMPTKIYKEPDEKLPTNTEMIFRIMSGYLIVNELCHDIISQYRLGKTHFSQVYIYDIETEEQLSDTPYYFINIAEKREFLDVENTHKGISTNEYNPNSGVYHLSSPVDDGIHLVSQAGLADVDLWHDPMLFGSLFLSNQLVTALLEAGISKDALALVRCQA